MIFAQIPRRRPLMVCMGAAVLAILAFLWWECERNPEVNFLASHGKAEWIIYPKPPDFLPKGDFEISTVFRRDFKLEGPPEMAHLAIRAFKHFEIAVNGKKVEGAANAVRNWKDPARFEIQSFLHAGTNEISITVFNKKAPPALWASLEMGSSQILSGPDWYASILGAAWRPAWLAKNPLKLERGNPVYAGESTFRDLSKSPLPVFLLIMLACGIVYLAVVRFDYAKRQRRFDIAKLMNRFVIGVAILWAALIINNLIWLPADIGFDAMKHIDYINHITTKKSLPLATDGWEMYQPPLYYTVCAGIVRMTGETTVTDREAATLRIVGLASGIAEIVLIFFSLKLLFPEHPGAQWFGTLLAAFLPEHLLISQFVTNEFLAAVFVTGMLYATLRLLEQEQDSWKLALAVGLCAGGALLTKFTPILAMPFVVLVLAERIGTKPMEWSGARMRTLVIFLVAAFVIAGWHYIRVWIHFGTPILSNWDAKSGFVWWTDKGFQTAGYLVSFGESLVRPYHSVVAGFGDGIYSTMWGDSYNSGTGSWESRPVWNYRLMTIGFLLGLLPMTVIVVGVVVCVTRFLRRPGPVWFLMLGIGLTTCAALFYLSLKFPYYHNAKAFYALMTLLPMCAVGAAGWEWLTTRAGKFSPVLYVLILIWALDAYASFWIADGTATTHTMVGSGLAREMQVTKAAEEWTKALEIDPDTVPARRYMIRVLAVNGKLDEALIDMKKLMAENPDDPAILLESAELLAKSGEKTEALEQLKRSIAIAPDDAVAYVQAAKVAEQSGENQQSADFSREALRIEPFDPETHLLLASALEGIGDRAGLERHMRIASALQPKISEADAHDQFGLVLFSVNRWQDAARQYMEASRLQPTEPKFYIHLAQNQAEAGRFDDAIGSATKAIALSDAHGDKDTATASRELIKAIQLRRASLESEKGR